MPPNQAVFCSVIRGTATPASEPYKLFAFRHPTKKEYLRSGLALSQKQQDALFAMTRKVTIDDVKAAQKFLAFRSFK